MRKIRFEYWEKGLYIREEEYYLSKKAADTREKELISQSKCTSIQNTQLRNTLSNFIRCLTKKKTSKVVCAR